MQDLVLGAALTDSIGADDGAGGALRLGAYAGQPQKPPSPDASGDASCGDGPVDAWQTCVGWCSFAGFPPRLGGAYDVFVQGTQGRIIAS